MNISLCIVLLIRKNHVKRILSKSNENFSKNKANMDYSGSNCTGFPRIESKTQWKT